MAAVKRITLFSKSWTKHHSLSFLESLDSCTDFVLPFSFPARKLKGTTKSGRMKQRCPLVSMQPSERMSSTLYANQAQLSCLAKACLTDKQNVNSQRKRKSMRFTEVMQMSLWSPHLAGCLSDAQVMNPKTGTCFCQPTTNQPPWVCSTQPNSGPLSCKFTGKAGSVQTQL